VLDRKVDEVGVNKDMVGWAKLGVVGKEEANFLFFEFLDADVV
jgi:hypothetical protein